MARFLPTEGSLVIYRVVALTRDDLPSRLVTLIDDLRDVSNSAMVITVSPIQIRSWHSNVRRLK